MESPLIACTAGVFYLFWKFLQSGKGVFFWAAAALMGLAFSCKFTAILLPPILGLAWHIDREVRDGGRPTVRTFLSTSLGMACFVALMLAANFVVTGLATTPISPNRGAHPSLGRLPSWASRLAEKLVELRVPGDWAGFIEQTRLQGRGGTSYLFGARRDRGWWHYYFVALAVKTPPAFWLLFVARAFSPGAWDFRIKKDGTLPMAIGCFLAITAIGSTRNYGLRYLLPMAPLAIVWASALAESKGIGRFLCWACVAGMGGAVASTHPHELSYFNAIAGGSRGGRHILSDSCLDWGQGAKGLARLQASRPEFRDLTLFYFGETDPAHYGVAGKCYVVNAYGSKPPLPPKLAATTRYLGVSTSLQWGPWGPEGYFRTLDAVEPAAVLDDGTIAIYETRP